MMSDPQGSSDNRGPHSSAPSYAETMAGSSITYPTCPDETQTLLNAPIYVPTVRRAEKEPLSSTVRRKRDALLLSGQGFFHDSAMVFWSITLFFIRHYWFGFFLLTSAITFTLLSHPFNSPMRVCMPSNYIAQGKEVIKGSITYNCQRHSKPAPMWCPPTMNSLISRIMHDKTTCTQNKCDMETAPMKKWLFFNKDHAKLISDVVLIEDDDKTTWPAGPNYNGTLKEVWVTFCVSDKPLSRIKEYSLKRMCTEMGCNIPRLMDDDHPGMVGKIHDEIVGSCGELSCWFCRELVLRLLCLPTIKTFIEMVIIMIGTLLLGLSTKLVKSKISKVLKERKNKRQDAKGKKNEEKSEVIQMEDEAKPKVFRSRIPSISEVTASMATMWSQAKAEGDDPRVVLSEHFWQLLILLIFLTFVSILLYLLSCYLIRAKRPRMMMTPAAAIALLIFVAQADASAVMANTLCTNGKCTSRALVGLTAGSSLQIMSGRESKSKPIIITLSEIAFTPEFKSLYFTPDGKFNRKSLSVENFCKVEECNYIKSISAFEMEQCECRWNPLINDKLWHSVTFQPTSFHEILKAESWNQKSMLEVTHGNCSERVALAPGQTVKSCDLSIWSSSPAQQPPVMHFVKSKDGSAIVGHAFDVSPVGGPIAGIIGWAQCPSPMSQGCLANKEAFGCSYWDCSYKLPVFQHAIQDLPLKVGKGELGKGGRFTVDYGDILTFTIESHFSLHSEGSKQHCKLEGSWITGKTNTVAGVKLTLSLSYPGCEFLVSFGEISHFYTAETKKHESFWTLQEGFDPTIGFISGSTNSTSKAEGEVTRGFTLSELVSTGYLSGDPVQGLVNHLQFSSLVHLMGSGGFLFLGLAVVLLVKS
nr:TPA_asm: putative glycoprotein [Alternaria tenuissima negative-stranded RNA virus 2]